MKKQYVYIGQYYHIKNKELPLDFKFGVTDDLNQREYSLSRTKSPIKYMILKAWELPSNVKREVVEKVIALIFDENKYDGCEWYDIDGDNFKDKIALLFDLLSKMVDDSNFNFIEVDLDKSSDGDVVEKEIEKEIRTGRKSASTNLKVEVGGVDISGASAKDGYINAIKEVLKNIDPVQFSLDFPKIFKLSLDDYPDYKRTQTFKVGDFYLDTHSSTKEKLNIINSIFEKYNIDININVV